MTAAHSPTALQRWERDSRYYLAGLDRDLFGTWVVTRVWGRIGTALGRIHHEPVASLAEGERALARIARERDRRGYRPHQPRT